MESPGNFSRLALQLTMHVLLAQGAYFNHDV